MVEKKHIDGEQGGGFEGKKTCFPLEKLYIYIYQGWETESKSKLKSDKSDIF